MVRSTVVALVVVLLLVKAVSSLSLFSSHWDERTQTIELKSQSAKAYEIVTANGTVDFDGQDDSAKTIELVAVCKGGANNEERAMLARDAIEVTTDTTDPQICKIGWHWRTPQESDWSAIVDFTLRAPKNVKLNVVSQNGRVFVKNLVGDAKIKTHNGEINTETSGESLEAETSNGEIEAKFSGHKLNLHSHNGRVAADLSDAHAVEGEIATHNGIVEVTIGKQTSCELVTKTGHGYRNSRGGKFGSGGGKLTASSRNGAVLIHRPSKDAEDDDD